MFTPGAQILVNVVFEVWQVSKHGDLAKSQSPEDRSREAPCMRGWRNTVEIVLFEITTLMKLYPSVVHAYTSTLRPVIVLFEPEHIDEVSNPIPPTSHCRESGPRAIR